MKQLSIAIKQGIGRNQEVSETEQATRQLREFLERKGLYYSDDIINIISSKLLYSERKAFLLRGPAGTGKTILATAIAEYLGADLVFFQCTYGTSEEDLRYKYVPSEKTRSGIKIVYGPLPEALRKSKTHKVVLVLDEFDKTRTTADSLLLDFLQNYRVSLYIDEKEQVIEGNPANLVVFLTSNDMREFSEPLTRRVTIITLNHLPTTKVFHILRKRFPENIALLLTQIYDDTIKAKLRKPATIQELMEMGEFLLKNRSVDLETLLKSFVIKYDDDWEKYISYVRMRKPYQFIEEEKGNQNQQDENQDVNEYYDPGEEEIKVAEPVEEEKRSVSELLQKLRVRKVGREELPVREVKEKEEVTLKVEDEDFETYTNIIKIMRPEPTDNPTMFGKFEVVLDENKKFIVSKEPLTAREAYKLSKKTKGEYYFEDEFIITINQYKNLINRLIDHANKVTYYTRNRIQVVQYGPDEEYGVVDIQIVDKDGGLVKIKTRGYIRGGYKEIVGDIIYETEDYRIRKKLETLFEDIVLGKRDLDLIPLRYLDTLIKLYNTSKIELVKTDNVSIDDVKKYVTIARNIKEKGFKVIFTTRGYDYNFYAELGIENEVVLNIGIGYKYATYADTEEIRLDIDDPRVDEILAKVEEKLREEKR